MCRLLTLQRLFAGAALPLALPLCRGLQLAFNARTETNCTPHLLPGLLPQARQPESAALLKQLGDAKSFYVTPAGSNDDW